MLLPDWVVCFNTGSLTHLHLAPAGHKHHHPGGVSLWWPHLCRGVCWCAAGHGTLHLCWWRSQGALVRARCHHTCCMGCSCQGQVCHTCCWCVCFVSAWNAGTVSLCVMLLPPEGTSRGLTEVAAMTLCAAPTLPHGLRSRAPHLSSLSSRRMLARSQIPRALWSTTTW